MSTPELAPVPKLGRLLTHGGTAADRLELPAAQVCSLLSSFQHQQPAGGCPQLPPAPAAAPHSLWLHTHLLSSFILPHLFLPLEFMLFIDLLLPFSSS